jgi:hypothetical protein
MMASYKEFTLSKFRFTRDDYFAHIYFPTQAGKEMEHKIDIDAFLKSLQRDIAWSFFYGMVKFDDVFGTINHYGTVEVFAGKYHKAFNQNGFWHAEELGRGEVERIFTQMLEDWVPVEFDPFAAPRETGSAVGPKRASNVDAIHRKRVLTTRIVKQSDRQGPEYPINDGFKGMEFKYGEMHIKPGHENKFGLVNLYEYLARSDVTWNPSIVSVLEHSLFCPTTEEHRLPIKHGNDRVEWFVQLNGQIDWEVCNQKTGELLAYVRMRPGDVCAMPSDIQHQGFAPERSMLLVWENADPKMPDKIRKGEVPGDPDKMVTMK